MKVGQKAPNFDLEAHDGSRVVLSTFLGKKNVVIFFYPKDDTPGWTIQVCEFRNHYEDFQSQDTEIFGVSADSADSHQVFAQKFALPYLLLMDEKRTLRRLWKVPKNLFIMDGRVSYVIDKKGICRFMYNSAVAPKKHISECLDFISKHLKG